MRLLSALLLASASFDAEIVKLAGPVAYGSGTVQVVEAWFDALRRRDVVALRELSTPGFRSRSTTGDWFAQQRQLFDMTVAETITLGELRMDPPAERAAVHRTVIVGVRRDVRYSSAYERTFKLAPPTSKVGYARLRLSLHDAQGRFLGNAYVTGRPRAGWQVTEEDWSPRPQWEWDRMTPAKR